MRLGRRLLAGQAREPGEVRRGRAGQARRLPVGGLTHDHPPSASGAASGRSGPLMRLAGPVVDHLTLAAPTLVEWEGLGMPGAQGRAGALCRGCGEGAVVRGS